MRTLLQIGLAGLLCWSSACRPDDSKDDPPDEKMDMGSMPAPSIRTTVRELNAPGSRFKPKDQIAINAVVVSPMMWTARPNGDDYCHYRIVVMHADGSTPTLQDGMVVTIDLKTPAGSMDGFGPCDDLSKKNSVTMAMDALKTGDAVDISGTFRSFGANGTRYVDVYGGKVVGAGPATIQPTPVAVADPTTFTIGTGSSPPQSFVDASGVLVEFKNVAVTARDKYQNFVVNSDTMNMGGATIASNFLKVLIGKDFMAPSVGAKFQSVVGIVLGDFHGEIWARGNKDLKM